MQIGIRLPHTTSLAGANELCRQAEATGQACLVLRQTSANWQLVNTKTRTHAARSPSPARAISKAQPAQTEGPAAKTGPRYRIQLAAYRHLKNAIKGKQILDRLLPEGFPGLAILKRDRRATSAAPIKFRIRSTGPWPESRARKFCDRARATGIACLLIRHGTKSWQLVSTDRPSHASIRGTDHRAAKPLNRTHLIATR